MDKYSTTCPNVNVMVPDTNPMIKLEARRRKPYSHRDPPPDPYDQMDFYIIEDWVKMWKILFEKGVFDSVSFYNLLNMYKTANTKNNFKSFLASLLLQIWKQFKIYKGQPLHFFVIMVLLNEVLFNGKYVLGDPLIHNPDFQQMFDLENTVRNMSFSFESLKRAQARAQRERNLYKNKLFEALMLQYMQQGGGRIPPNIVVKLIFDIVVSS